MILYTVGCYLNRPYGGLVGGLEESSLLSLHVLLICNMCGIGKCANGISVLFFGHDMPVRVSVN